MPMYIMLTMYIHEQIIWVSVNKKDDLSIYFNIEHIIANTKLYRLEFIVTSGPNFR